MQTSEQQRAADALRRVRDLDGQTDELKSRYRSYVDRLGPTILMNGLGQALATERAAAGPSPDGPATLAHQRLGNNVQSWLCRDGGVYPTGQDVLTALTSHDATRYLRAQAESLAWLEWHKKFCRAELPRGQRDD